MHDSVTVRALQSDTKLYARSCLATPLQITVLSESTLNFRPHAFVMSHVRFQHALFHLIPMRARVRRPLRSQLASGKQCVCVCV
jgi:hypothetical protein